MITLLDYLTLLDIGWNNGNFEGYLDRWRAALGKDILPAVSNQPLSQIPA
jgi:hypothetical protein